MFSRGLVQDSEVKIQKSSTASLRLPDWVVALGLFLATAAVVVWQNFRLTVLWDLSYILENAHRISLGDVPYRDFPLPYAPLTFLVQAALIKLTGRVFWHHVAYAAAVGGAATVVTWRILLNVLRGSVKSARLLAFVLSLPLAVLGIYCVFPHPFYDCDCTFAILLGILFWQQAEQRQFPPVRSFLTGVALVVPLFVKQNTGLAFLICVVLALLFLIGLENKRRHSISGLLWMIGGIAAGLALALLLIHFIAGLGNYRRWTIDFAAARRMPPLGDMLSVYRYHALPWWLAAFAVGVVMLWKNHHPAQNQRTVRKLPHPSAEDGARMGHPQHPQMVGHPALAWLSPALMAAPFGWAVIYLFLDPDPSERAERLLLLWPIVVIVCLATALLSARRRSGLALVLPFIVIGTAHGAFLSQQLWGSTYAIWPLFMLLVADIFAALTGLFETPHPKTSHPPNFVPLASAIALSLLVAGACYVKSHERLDYADVSSGEMFHSKLPALAGLSARGQWIPQFEELVGFSEREIPKQDGLLMIPGEDLFYYTTGRHPRFPVVMFDHTVNPYSPEEIASLVRSRGIRWLVVKKDLQLEEDPVQDRRHLFDLLGREFKLVEQLDNYDIYKIDKAQDR